MTNDNKLMNMLTGYAADMSLFDMVGVELAGESQVPRYDKTTMQTNVPGLFVAGTATAGSQQSGVRVFVDDANRIREVA